MTGLCCIVGDVRAVTITRYGPSSVLEVRQSPDPEPVEGEVRIRVEACGLNFAEVSARQGLYPDAPKPPCVVGYEGAGVVDALGPGADGPAVGTRVLFMSRFGAHASMVCTPSWLAFPIPEKMSFEDAAAIPVNYLTAYHMLFRIARIRSGDQVLVHMAAGGVGTAALQLCRTVPGVTTYGTSSARKHDYVRGHGCDHPIDYRTQDYAEEIMRLTDGRGVDVILDALGGPDWKKGYDILAKAGLLVAFGMANAISGGKRSWFHVIRQVIQIPRFNPMKMMSENKAVAGVNLGHLWDQREMLLDEMQALVRLYEEDAIKPHIHATVPFDRASEAHEMLEGGQNLGKVVLVP
jgi:NADPH:quinone reductase-like Zn-dependent oxidoreductase